VKDSQFGSWSTTQEHTNNLKDKGIEDKNTFSPCIKNNKKKPPGGSSVGKCRENEIP
jgi:hypothetical protein